MGTKATTNGRTATGSTVEAPQEDRAALLTLKAYELWQARGCPEGDALRDWLEAERALGGEASAERASADEHP